MNILVTGGSGFIGSNFIRLVLSRLEDARVINLDKLTYAGNRANLSDVEDAHWGDRYFFVEGDICDRVLVNSLFDGTYIGIIAANSAAVPDIVVNFAAETHVDRSIADSTPFVNTNVLGTHVLLEAARRNWGGNDASPDTGGRRLFLQVSTDEVYGCLDEEGCFDEDSPLQPNNPYSASKAGADLLVRSYHQTYGFPAIVTRCCNNYGPYQFPEKFIPMLITRALADATLPIYGNGRNVRGWLYVEDHCEAIMLVLQKGELGEVYNISARAERRNLEVAKHVLKIMNKPATLISFVSDRLGHDWRYASDNRRISDLGWEPTHRFEDGLEQTVRWYLEHQDWWKSRSPASAGGSDGQG